jgi:hypothetical protein
MLKAVLGTSPLYPLPISTWGCTPGVKNKKNIPYFSLYGQVQCHLSDITIAQYLDLGKVITTTQGITKNIEFHCLLIQLLSTEQEQLLYNLALSVSCINDSVDQDLLNILWGIDKSGILLGKVLSQQPTPSELILSQRSCFIYKLMMD